MKFKFILFTFFLSVNANFVFAQAIKLTLIEYNEVGRTGTDNSAFGIGYEQNLNSRISILINPGMEYPDDLDDTFSYDYRDGLYQYDNDVTDIGFSRKHTTLKLTFESRYFFRDNDENSWYMASKASFQSRKETTIIHYIGDYNSPQTSFHDIEVNGEYSQSVFITPLSLTIGHRSNLEGFIFDFNFGYAFLPKNVYDLSIPTGSIIDKSVTYHKSTITFGLSIGIGWASY
ncbi:MAG: hypothetical protein IPP27_13360 [Bacteroidetes bacterium]|nr:hypothetical protein [Bacteroidota bacterium]